tara:strand:- start:271 stop:546 length:276 start_codon:yes stop_codon:yes gene_type:complete
LLQPGGNVLSWTVLGANSSQKFHVLVVANCTGGRNETDIGIFISREEKNFIFFSKPNLLFFFHEVAEEALFSEADGSDDCVVKKVNILSSD